MANPLPLISKDQAEEGRFFDTRPEIVRKVLECRDFTVLLWSAAGTGKAQPLDSIVWMPSGPKRMGDLRIGDQICSVDGSTTTVTGIYPQGEQVVYRVYFSTDEVAECTLDHLWTVHYSGGRRVGDMKYKEMSRTMTLAEILAAGERKKNRYYVPAVQPVHFQDSPVPIHPYALGVILGDGHICPNGNACITSVDQMMIDEVQSLLPFGHTLKKVAGSIDYTLSANRRRSQSKAQKGYVSRTSSGKWMARGWEGAKQIYLGSYVSKAEAESVVARRPALPPVGEPTVAESLESLQLAGKRSWEKFIPDLYLINSQEKRLSLLQGLMDTDGTACRKTGMPSFASSSLKLAEQVKWLVQSLGGACRITKKKTARRDSHVCHIRIQDPSTLFRLERKKAITKLRTKYKVKRYIERIEQVGAKPCQCIAVDHPSCLYLTDGFIPTHNTRIILEKLRVIALKYANCRIIILRSVRAWLTQSALVTWEQNVLMPNDTIPDRIRASHRAEYRFPNGSVVVVAGLDDVQKAMSAEFDIAYIQESTEISEETFEIIRNRLRWAHVPYQQLLMDCNPTYPNHWIKKLIDANKITHFQMFHKDNPAFWDQDRQCWTPRGKHYVETVLESLTGTRRARLKDGRWVQAEGVVYDEWSPELHLIEPFEIPPTWERYLSIDFGYNHPLVIQWWAIDEDGGLYMYREIFKTHLMVQDAATWVVRETSEAREPPANFAICDHDREDRATFERHSRLYTIAALKDILPGIEDVKARLTPKQNGIAVAPRLFLFKNARCHEPDPELQSRGSPTCTADEFDAYVWDTNARAKERPLDLHNHGMDAVRYMVRYVDHAMGSPVNRDSVRVGEPSQFNVIERYVPSDDAAPDSFFERFPG
jgi:phage terminase large subunit